MAIAQSFCVQAWELNRGNDGVDEDSAGETQRRRHHFHHYRSEPTQGGPTGNVGASVFLRFDPGLTKPPQYDTGVLFEVYASSLPVAFVPSASHNAGSYGNNDENSSKPLSPRPHSSKWTVHALVAEGGRYDKLVSTFAAVTRPPGRVHATQGGSSDEDRSATRRSWVSPMSPWVPSPVGDGTKQPSPQMLRTDSQDSMASVESQLSPSRAVSLGEPSRSGRRSSSHGGGSNDSGIHHQHVIGVTFALSTLAEFVHAVDRRITASRHSPAPAQSLHDVLRLRLEAQQQRDGSQRWYVRASIRPPLFDLVFSPSVVPTK